MRAVITISSFLLYKPNKTIATTPALFFVTCRDDVGDPPKKVEVGADPRSWTTDLRRHHNMDNRYCRVLFFFLLPAAAISLKLPNYLVACKRDDPKIDECVVKHGQEAIPRILQGDPKYRAPKLEPMEITELRVNQGTRQVGLKMILRNAKLYGLKNTKFLKAKTELKKRRIEWTFKIPRVEIIGDYEVNGQVLILPIIGIGKANVTITDLDIVYKYEWDLIKKNGKEYMTFTKSQIDFKNGQTYFDLKNLFNGDQFLGNNMNRFLNENWKEVTSELGPAVGQAFSDLFRNLLTNVAAQVPFNEIYLS